MIRRIVWTAVSFITLALLAACSAGQSEPAITAEDAPAPEPTPTEEVIAVNLDDLGPAPEIENEIWLNTDQPLPLSSQAGKVVLLEFWTFG